MTRAVEAHLLAGFDDYVAELKEFCRIPIGQHRSGLRRRHAPRRRMGRRDRLSAAGMSNVEIAQTGGHPAVLAEWLDAPAGAPTVLVYGHYDVQPPDPVALWTTPPFEPTVRDGRLYARGAADDKGPVLVPILVAEAFLRATGRLPVNLKFLIEGEEEVGSAHLGSFLAANADRLAADTIVSADGAMWRVDLPTVTVASRGICALEFTRPRRRQGSALRPAWRHRAEPAACHGRHGREPARHRRPRSRRRLS